MSESVITVRDWLGPSDVRETAVPRKRTLASERVDFGEVLSRDIKRLALYKPNVA